MATFMSFFQKKSFLEFALIFFFFFWGLQSAKTFDKKPLVPTNKKGCKVFEHNTWTSSCDVNMALGGYYQKGVHAQP
jgi:hypothetical protein